jgi:DNA modification methylase
VNNIDVKYIDINEIKPYGRNNKIHSERQTKLIAESIKEFGFKNPIIIDNKNVIIAGHGRLLAAQHLKLDKVPVIIATDLTKEQVRAYRIADNKLADLGEYDLDNINFELTELKESGYDFGSLGLDLELDLEPEVENITEDEPPEVDDEKEPYTKQGDTWLLGRHRLMCGDSTDKATVETLMSGQKADLYLTDPPYNVNYESKSGMKIQNDDMKDEAFKAFLIDAFVAANENLKKGAAVYIWHAGLEGYNFKRAFKACWELRQILIWNKNSLVMGRQDYQWKHEPCLYGWKEGAGHYFIDDRTQTTVIEDKNIDFKKMKKEELVELLKEIYSDKISTTIINEQRPSASQEHPTMKPLKLLARQIKNSSRINEMVLDSFAGSGSTLIACEKLNRICYTMELDEKYCDVIVKRYNNLGKDDITLIRNGEEHKWADIKKDITE